MATKAFFDGVKLTVTELPDAPLPSVLNVRKNSLDAIINPTGVDPGTLLVDAAELPNLRPTDGALPPTKFPDEPPGNGEGPGIGQPSGSTALRDPWANNPNRDKGTVESMQSGEIGSALEAQAKLEAERTALKIAARNGDKSAQRKLEKLDESAISALA
jgi:hypothetical protein